MPGTRAVPTAVSAAPPSRRPCCACGKLLPPPLPHAPAHAQSLRGARLSTSSVPVPRVFRGRVCQRRPCAAAEMFTFQTPLRGTHKFSAFERKQIRVHLKRFVKKKQNKQKPPLSRLLTAEGASEARRAAQELKARRGGALALHQRLTDLSHLSLEPLDEVRTSRFGRTTSAQLSHPEYPRLSPPSTPGGARPAHRLQAFTRAFGSGLEKYKVLDVSSAFQKNTFLMV